MRFSSKSSSTRIPRSTHLWGTFACAVNYRKAKFTFPDAPFLSSRYQSPSSRASLPHLEHKIEVFVRFQASEPSISGFSSTKSGFLCAFRLRSPRFQAFRAQNRHFCALLGSGSPVFGHFEHKIEVFVRFEALEPPFSGVSSTKSGFLCAFGCRDPRFLAFHSYWRNIFGLWSNLTPHLWWLMY